MTRKKSYQIKISPKLFIQLKKSQLHHIFRAQTHDSNNEHQFCILSTVLAFATAQQRLAYNRMRSRQLEKKKNIQNQWYFGSNGGKPTCGFCEYLFFKIVRTFTINSW